MSDFNIVFGFIVFCVLVLAAAYILVREAEAKQKARRQAYRDEQNRLAAERLNKRRNPDA